MQHELPICINSKPESLYISFFFNKIHVNTFINY